MIPALVPFKARHLAKSRLRPGLGPATEPLTLAMLGDVIECLLAVDELEPVFVVTPDEQVAAAARELGARALVRDDPGLNPALDAAAAEIAGQSRALLIVLGDVPGARPEEIREMLEAAPGRGVVLAPSRDGGTSALLRVPPDVIPGAFGPESAARHRKLARAAGVACVELSLPSLDIDVDDVHDLGALLGGSAPAPRTRALLRELRPELA